MPQPARVAPPPGRALQSFDDRSEGSQSAARIAALRAELARRGLAGWLVPRADEHQNEYLPSCEERLAWLTGFTGSAGFAIVLAGTAAIFVDGRYTVQVREQVDTGILTPLDTPARTPEEWLVGEVQAGERIGCDPRLHTAEEVKRWRERLSRAGAELVTAADNPIDALWRDRPAPPAAPIVPHELAFAGEAAAAKLARVQAELRKERLAALVVSDPHAIAWLFNIRGGDVEHTPLPLAHAILPAEGRPTLFAAPAKLSPATRAHLADAADIAEPAALTPALQRLAGRGGRIRLDRVHGSEHLRATLAEAGAEPDVGADPIALLKAVKNMVELEGSRAAHRRDGAAVASFLAWFDAEAPGGKLTEIDAALALEGFRAATNLLRDLSFPTISAAGAHAALPHYRVSRASNAPIGEGLYLVDSGAQYLDGTTDITRTLAVGKVTPEMRRRYTLVLKGHIAVATAVFPKGTSGAQLDSFARRPLWEAGLDFDHGTGHGVGSYLSVHEGPQRLSKLGTTPLQPGMLLSNEPGYYHTGGYGIRLENLIAVEPREIPGAEREMLGFETLTLAPFDRRLIVRAMLTAPERRWIDAYHARVLAALSAQVDATTRHWLDNACKAL